MSYPTSPLSITPRKNWCTAPARIPHYLTRALNSIHFASLRRLHLDFPLTRRKDLNIIEDVCYAAFPLFVTNLGYACNLEYLHFDAGRLMITERAGQIDAMLDVLHQNLQRCRKLRDLSVRNVGVDRNGNCLWSVALLQALIPTIIKRKYKLRKFKICMSGTASDPAYAKRLLDQGIDVTFEFYTAVLSLAYLETLEIELSLAHLESLIRVFDVADSSQKLSQITMLKIAQGPSTDESNDLGSAVFVLNHFSECSKLKYLYLDLPFPQWKDSYLALHRLICNKPGIQYISLCFSCYRDDGGKIMKALLDFSRQKDLHSLKEVSLFGLFDTSSEYFSLLQVAMAEKGMTLSRCREKFGKTSPHEFNLIICKFERVDYRSL